MFQDSAVPHQNHPYLTMSAHDGTSGYSPIRTTCGRLVNQVRIVPFTPANSSPPRVMVTPGPPIEHPDTDPWDEVFGKDDEGIPPPKRPKLDESTSSASTSSTFATLAMSRDEQIEMARIELSPPQDSPTPEKREGPPCTWTHLMLAATIATKYDEERPVKFQRVDNDVTGMRKPTIPEPSTPPPTVPTPEDCAVTPKDEDYQPIHGDPSPRCNDVPSPAPTINEVKERAKFLRVFKELTCIVCNRLFLNSFSTPRCVDCIKAQCPDPTMPCSEDARQDLTSLHCNSDTLWEIVD